MCLRRSLIFLGAFSMCCAGADRASGQGEGFAPSAEWIVERYLEERGLTHLLAADLEQRLESARGEERTRLAERLAAIYVEQMEEADTQEARALIQEKARALVQEAGGLNSPDLTIMLDRAAYIRAESLAEEWRVRFREREALEEAIAIFQVVGDELDVLARAAHRRVQELERQQDEGRRDDELLSHMLREERRRRSQAFYLAGWCNTYLAEFAGVQSAAQSALRQFGWVLQSSDGEPANREKFPADLLRFEHVSRSAVGVAACFAALGQTGEALAWLDIVDESEETPADVRAELAARRMTVLAYTGRWPELADFVDALLVERGAAGLTSAEARLLTVLCLEGTSRNAETRRIRETLASIGVSMLVARGELTQTLDLARRYGESLVGSRGFIGLHVRGLLAYEAARSAHLASGRLATEPVQDPKIAALFQKAADALAASIEAPDAGEHASAAARARSLLGLCLYMSAPMQPDAGAAFVEAARVLHEASDSADEPESSESAALAIQALEQAIATRNAPTEAPQLLQAYVDAFLDAHSSHPAAGAMLYRKANAAGLRDEDRVSLLLRVSSNSNAYGSARRRASQLLFVMWEQAPPDTKNWAAGRYVEVAETVFFIDMREAEAGDQTSLVRVLSRGRRLLAAMLSLTGANPDRAERVLDSIATSGALDAADASERANIESELTYRRAQMALARGDLSLARALAEEVSAGDGGEGELGAYVGERLLFAHAVERWRFAKRARSPKEELTRLTRVVLEEGANLLALIDEHAGTVDDEVQLGVETATAEAAHDLWMLTDDVRARALAIALHRRVLAQHPGSASFLRRMAELSEAAADRQTALECWRTLSSGLDSSEPAWFEARYRLLRLLMQVDRRRARDVIAQHAVLHPNYGPAPWGARLRQLHEELGGT